jgi:cytochrome bd ubiquinol oxidase subunit II
MEALWFWMVSVMIAIYAVTDGFDFGAGILHTLVGRTDHERRQVLGAIGPYWDGNEVWLLAGGGSLLLAFPKVLASGFSGFYLALFMVVWTLIMRGIAIEFRNHLADGLWRALFDAAFTGASVLLPILLGAALGNVVRGVPIDASGFFNLPLFTDFRAGNPLGILDWYTVLIGIFVLCTVTSHGALFLAWKTEGPVHERARRFALPLSLLTAVVGGVSTLATAHVNPDLFARLPHAPLAWLGLAVLALGLCLVFWGQIRARHLTAFLGSAAFMIGLLATSAACLFPVMLRSTLDPAWSLTAHNAAAEPHGLRAGLAWWVVGFPLAIAYFAFLFRLHRGKVRVAEDGEGPGY